LQIDDLIFALNLKIKEFN